MSQNERPTEALSGFSLTFGTDTDMRRLEAAVGTDHVDITSWIRQYLKRAFIRGPHAFYDDELVTSR